MRGKGGTQHSAAGRGRWRRRRRRQQMVGRSPPQLAACNYAGSTCCADGLAAKPPLGPGSELASSIEACHSVWPLQTLLACDLGEMQAPRPACMWPAASAMGPKEAPKQFEPLSFARLYPRQQKCDGPCAAARSCCASGPARRHPACRHRAAASTMAMLHARAGSLAKAWWFTRNLTAAHKPNVQVGRACRVGPSQRGRHAGTPAHSAPGHRVCSGFHQVPSAAWRAAAKGALVQHATWLGTEATAHANYGHADSPMKP